MGLLQLFIAATMPVLKVLLVTGLGSFLATDYVNILGEDARKHLNTIVFFVFNPALVCTTLSRTITYESMVKLWFMPFNILLTFIIGSALGWIVIQVTRPPQHLQGLVIGCCAAGNMGNLLLIIIPAVCKEKGSPFGDPGVCQSYGMAYVSLSLALGAIYLWSYVYNIVRISSKRDANDLDVKTIHCNEASQPLLLSTEVSTIALPYTWSDGEAKVTVLKKIEISFRKLMAKVNLKALLTPSTTAAMIGFIVGLVPQIRRAMIGDDAPLRVIQDSTSLVGEASIPVLTLIVGGNLLAGLRDGRGIEKVVVIGIIIARYIALPLLGIAVVKLAIHYGLVKPDPLYQFVLLLQFAVPPAMNMGTITQLFGAGESECSVIMLWTYSLASVSLTLWPTLFMWLVA